jgi:hypothetical protein
MRRALGERVQSRLCTPRDLNRPLADRVVPVGFNVP